MSDPYREVVDGPVHRLVMRARPAPSIRFGLPFFLMLTFGAYPMMFVLATSAQNGWPASVTLGVAALTVVASWLGGAAFARAFAADAWKSRSIEVDRDRRIVRYSTPRSRGASNPEQVSLPFASIRSVFAIDGCVGIETDEGLRYAVIDINHRMLHADAIRIAKRIEELVVAEMGELAPRVRIEQTAPAERDAAHEAEAEAEASVPRDRRWG